MVILATLLELVFKARHGVAQHPLESGIGSFGAVSGGSSRCASGSGWGRGECSCCFFRYAFVEGFVDVVVGWVTLGVEREREEEEEEEEKEKEVGKLEREAKIRRCNQPSAGLPLTR
jgi:hypothetical protein